MADVQALAKQCSFKMKKTRSKHEEFALGPDRICLNAEVDGYGAFNYPPNWNLHIECVLPAGYSRCTTYAQPYDALVSAALLAIKHHLGDDVKATSMGGPQHPAWQKAKALYASTFPEREIPVFDNWPAAQVRVKRTGKHSATKAASTMARWWNSHADRTGVRCSGNVGAVGLLQSIQGHHAGRAGG